MHKIYIETTDPDNGKRTNEYRFFEYLLELLELQVQIIGIGGKKRFKDFDNVLKDTTKSGFKNLIIVDADGDWNTENWDFESEKKKITNLKKQLGIEFELFLLPNHETMGDFETLLEVIVHQNHKRVIECHTQFEQCIEKYEGYVTPNRKARMYSYITSFKRSQKENEKFKNEGNWFFSDESLWDFSVDELKPLKTFILSLIKE